jgi:TonB family protein
MKIPKLYRILLFSGCLLPTSALGSDACLALNPIEVFAALRATVGVATKRGESPNKMVFLCNQKSVPGPGDGASLSAAGPELTIIVSDPGGPPVVDPKITQREPLLPALGDRATIVSGPVTAGPNARMSYRVAVTTGSQTYALIYVPSVMDEESRDIAVHLAREVLTGNFRGQLDSHPIAEQLIARDRTAVAQKSDDVQLWNEIGLFSQYLKRYDDARKAYLKISQLLPKDPGGYLGIATADWGKAFSKRTELANERGIGAADDIALDTGRKDICDILRKSTRTVIDEGYDNAKKASELQPDIAFESTVLSVLARQKAWTDCGDPEAAKNDTTEADHFLSLKDENMRARGMSRKSPRIAVALDPPQPPMPFAAFGVGAAPVQGPQGVNMTPDVGSGVLVNKVNPVYPPLARQARIQGVVTLKAQIGKDGNIMNLEVISGHPLLAPAAIEAAKQWKYKPFRLNGEPVPVDTQIQINFTLSSGPASPPSGAPPAQTQETSPH